MTFITTISALCIVLVATIYIYFKSKFRYWRDRNVPFVNPKIPLGNLQGHGKRLHSAHLMQKFYQQLKGKGPFGGIYFFVKQVVLALDVDFVKNILVKDFQYFQDRGVYYNERDDPLSAHLFALDGLKWKTLRSKLTPTFTSGKMKFMYPTIVAVADVFRECLTNMVANGDEVEMKDILARFTTDVIGTCAFGIECNSLHEPDSEFRHMGKRVFHVSRIKQSFLTSFKRFARFWRMKTINPDVSEFFMKLVRDTVDYREQNHIKRNDFMDLLIQLKNNGKLDGASTSSNDIADNGKLSMNEMAAQAFVFFVAGFETSSTALTFCLYELAQNQDIQNKARTEVESVLEKHNGQFTYEAMMEMNYLGQILSGELFLFHIFAVHKLLCW